MNYQITEYCHNFVMKHIQSGDICIDATVGRGGDTLFLSELVGDRGKVIGLDIQSEAIEYTEARLERENIENTVIYRDGHENIDKYASKDSVACIVFNFGYLPGGDHNIATKSSTSIEAIKRGLTLLKKGGIMSLCIYSGKDTGFEEKDAILKYIETLDQREFLVIVSTYYNRKNNPPIPAFIIKIR